MYYSSFSFLSTSKPSQLWSHFFSPDCWSHLGFKSTFIVHPSLIVSFFFILTLVVLIFVVSILILSVFVVSASVGLFSVVSTLFEFSFFVGVWLYRSLLSCLPVISVASVTQVIISRFDLESSRFSAAARWVSLIMTMFTMFPHSFCWSHRLRTNQFQRRSRWPIISLSLLSFPVPDNSP